MIIPGKQRIGFILMLLALAALLVAGGAWAFFTGYGFVLFDAATGAVSEVRHLNDLFILQNAVWLLGVIVASILAVALALLYMTERRRVRNLDEIIATLKANAAGDWDRVPRVHAEETEGDLASVVVALAKSNLAGKLHERGGVENIEADGKETMEIECGLLKPRPEPIGVRDFIGHVADDFKNLAKPKGLSLRLQVAKALPSVNADRLKLRYVFDEFMRNAINCSPVGGRVTLQVARVGKFLKFEVHDEGPGIPPDEQPQVFKKTFRSSKYNLVRPNAPISGLFVSKKLVERFGGEAGLSSVEGGGSVFHFTLPVAETTESRKDVQRPKPRTRRKTAVPGRNGRRRP